ncbi:RNA polymerase sigma-70 factor [Mariniflexile litorale]|uniref:RNA polymerase sigma-70 factor n=1 Tax=Mariniflexile litorale TaxID=3045158 RepID=A0AAU7ECX3_9FLAO|nr:RNA polymerase sigma-70 factor [Mariniflexile sp. KMM 9835]MDQ8212889.1 RNA polymerase sigma-70 factor [Mariniflexile sp. KMM 9835]
MNYENQNDLIQGIRRGDESAFVYALDKYNKPLFAYAISLTHDAAMAQDILQNVFLKTWEKRTKLKISVSFQNYLYRSVHNEFINQYKQNKSIVLLEQKYSEALENVIASNDETFFENSLKHIAFEIENLPPKCKKVFILSRKEGLTNIEIANYLDISIKAVEAHINKAFTTLKKKCRKKI